jgi:peptidylprolyl isomerase
MSVLRIENIQGDDVIKEVTLEGTGPCPQNGDEIVAHYTGRLLNGTIFDSSVQRNAPFKFTLGTGSVIKLWDMGFATMKKGEKGFLQGTASYCYGASGSPPTIPPNATLRFEVELISFGPKAREIYELSATEKLEEAAKRKDAGNSAFTSGDVRTARDEWDYGSRCIDSELLGLDPDAPHGGAKPSWEQPLTEEQVTLLRTLRVSLPANKAMADLKLGDFYACIKSATEALKFDPSHVKSLFRRGCAKNQVGDFDEAKEDLKKAQLLAPTDAAIKAELAKVNSKIQAQRAKEKKAFGGWATRGLGLSGDDDTTTSATASKAEVEANE